MPIEMGLLQSIIGQFFAQADCQLSVNFQSNRSTGERTQWDEIYTDSHRRQAHPCQSTRNKTLDNSN